MGENVEDIEKINADEIHVKLESQKILPCSTVLVAAGRFANSGGLNLDKVGVELGNNGLIKTNENFQTAQPNIFAVGDVIGFPGLASTSMSQARIAVLHAFGQLESEKMPKDLPLGIWTIPAISMVGKTEEELTDDCKTKLELLILRKFHVPTLWEKKREFSNCSLIRKHSKYWGSTSLDRTPQN